MDRLGSLGETVWYGEKFPSSSSINIRENTWTPDGVAHVLMEHSFQVPIGYDGGVVCIYSFRSMYYSYAKFLAEHEGMVAQLKGYDLWMAMYYKVPFFPTTPWRAWTT